MTIVFIDFFRRIFFYLFDLAWETFSSITAAADKAD